VADFGTDLLRKAASGRRVLEECGMAQTLLGHRDSKSTTNLCSCHTMHVILYTKRPSERQSMPRFQMALCHPKWTFAWGLLQSSFIKVFANHTLRIRVNGFTASACRENLVVSTYAKYIKIHHYTTSSSCITEVLQSTGTYD